MTNKNPFPSPYEEFIYKSRYARWLDEEGRRENWDETVDRLVDYYYEAVNDDDIPPVGDMKDWNALRDAIYNLEVMPSMRALMTAGPALDRCNVAAYNCAYLPVDSPRSFDEAMYILMCGTGVGYSVENKYVEQLPKISEEFEDTETVIRVADSKEGWAKSFRELVSLLIAGQTPKWDVSRVRAAGERLKTFGGRASGPEPLEDLFRFAVSLFQRAAGRRLTSIECHDLMCKIADIVVVGGVRRSAMISLFDFDDKSLLNSKSIFKVDEFHFVDEDKETGFRKYGVTFNSPGYGIVRTSVELKDYDVTLLERENKLGWWVLYGHRRLANNSAVYTEEQPTTETFIEKWKAIYDSKSGEPGLFSRYACQKVAQRNGRRNSEVDFGTNPCSEIILRPFEFCNLTEVVVRPTDDIHKLEQKVRVATILGTIQSTFTNFRYLRKIWQDNCNEERLLGVSLTGVCDNLDLITKENLNDLREIAIRTNEEWAGRLGIPVSAAITCVKPSGTVSQLVNASSGLHRRHSDYYLRTVRADNKDPMTVFLKEQGVYNEQDITAPLTTTVFYFPVKSPEGAALRKDETSVGALELWRLLQENWCEHKPSATISVREEDWMEVGAWVYKNFDGLSGVSFLPYDGGSYKQAPYQELSKEDWEAWVAEHPSVEIDWDKLTEYEKEDNTTGSQEYACTGNVCEIVDIGTA
jgi:ribonucleoside-diphosphate reductase alpha chain